jgi:lipid A 4'-phosphatase
MRASFLIFIILATLAALVLWSGFDLAVSGFFYRPGQGFFLADEIIFVWLHKVAYYGARVFGILLALVLLAALIRRKPLMGVSAKGWLFLLLGLLLGPGLVANTVFKDHWGRARPREIIEFGGAAHFSPALLPSDQCARNCSFVSGDGAFGFYLPAFAYVAPRPRTRRFFWVGAGLGALFGFVRLAVGAHFLSDILFAALFVQSALALLHAAMFGFKETRKCWRDWIFLSEKSKA